MAFCGCDYAARSVTLHGVDVGTANGGLLTWRRGYTGTRADGAKRSTSGCDRDKAGGSDAHALQPASHCRVPCSVNGVRTVIDYSNNPPAVPRHGIGNITPVVTHYTMHTLPFTTLRDSYLVLPIYATRVNIYYCIRFFIFFFFLFVDPPPFTGAAERVPELTDTWRRWRYSFRVTTAGLHDSTTATITIDALVYVRKRRHRHQRPTVPAVIYCKIA